MSSSPEIRDFLMSRREKLQPEDVGLPRGTRRRVPGLRREEVATLAGVSIDYYVQVERGQMGGVSDEVLAAIARALQLDDIERAHLFDLARGSSSTRRARTAPVRVPTALRQLLDAIVDAPAVIQTGALDIVAANALGRALYRPVFETQEEPNLARYVYLDDDAVRFYDDWDAIADDVAAMLRVELADAGYNILTYDLRNCGRSAADPAGTSGLGLVEARDVVGSVRYAKERWPEMTVGLWSRCMGANSTVMAMDFYPEEFEDITAVGLLNVVSGKAFITKGAEMAKLDPAKAADRLDVRIRKLTGFRLDEETPRPHAHAVTKPTFMAVLRRDYLIDAEKDGNEIFDALGAQDKELFWIEDSNQRFYAYNYFGDHPEKLIAWFDAHMS